MKRFFALTKAMFLIHVRERTTLFWNIGFPLFLLIINAAIWGGNNVASFMTWMMPGVIAINILSFGLIGSSAMIVEMRRKGVLRRLQASPAPITQLIGSYLLVNVLIGLLQAVVVIVFAVLVYGVELQAFGAARALLMVVVTIVMAVALGQIVSGIAPSIGAAVAIGQIFYFGQMFVIDAILPSNQLPAWIQKVSNWLPGYAIVQLVRTPLVDGTFDADLWMNLLKTVVYMALGFTIAAMTFRWEANNE